jgi:hypothetical protein
MNSISQNAVSENNDRSLPFAERRRTCRPRSGGHKQHHRARSGDGRSADPGRQASSAHSLDVISLPGPCEHFSVALSAVRDAPRGSPSRASAGSPAHRSRRPDAPRRDRPPRPACRSARRGSGRAGAPGAAAASRPASIPCGPGALRTAGCLGAQGPSRPSTPVPRSGDPLSPAGQTALTPLARRGRRLSLRSARSSAR